MLVMELLKFMDRSILQLALLLILIIMIFYKHQD